MHWDQKLGLALAICLIGFAAAFGVGRPSLKLPDVRPIPRALPEAPAQTRAAVRADQVFVIQPDPRSTPAATNLPAALMQHPPASYQGEDRQRDPEPESEPLGQSAGRSPADPSGGTLTPTAAATPSPAASSGSAAPSPSPDAPPRAAEPLWHVVEPGETLSDLSLRYFGGVGRYRDIFEANRDILSDPDRVRAGMRLRIPLTSQHGREFSAATRSPADPSRPEKTEDVPRVAEQVTLPPPARRRSFEPAPPR